MTGESLRISPKYQVIGVHALIFSMLAVFFGEDIYNWLERVNGSNSYLTVMILVLALLAYGAIVGLLIRRFVPSAVNSGDTTFRFHRGHRLVMIFSAITGVVASAFGRTVYGWLMSLDGFNFYVATLGLVVVVSLWVIIPMTWIRRVSKRELAKDRS